MTWNPLTRRLPTRKTSDSPHHRFARAAPGAPRTMMCFTNQKGPEMRRAIVAFVIALWPIPVDAQRGKSSREAVPLTRYVPAQARLYLSARGVQSLADVLQTAHAWRALSLAGFPVSEDGPPTDLEKHVARFLGVDPSHARELAEAEIGVVADGGADPTRAIWLVRLRDPSAVDRWYPPSGRTARATAGNALKFRMKDGLIVGVRDDVILVGRRWPGDAVLLDSFRALQGDDVPVLETSAGYQELARHLPEHWRAYAYGRWEASDDKPVAERPAKPREPSVAPSREFDGRLLVALYENEQGLDIAVRGAIPHEWASQRIEPHAVERLLQLPSSTVAGAVFRPSLSAITSPSNSLVTALGDRLLRFITRLYNVAPESVGPLPRMGPHVVIAWDQDLSVAGNAPELAILIESDDPPRLRDALAGLFGNWKMLVERHGGALPIDMRIETTEHLGQTVMSLSLGALAKESALPVARLFEGLTPSWVATDNWLVVGLSPGHVERIVDAQRGLVLPVGALQDTRQLQRLRAGSTLTLFAQANLASAVIGRWVAAAGEGAPSLLGAGWRSAISGGPTMAARRTLGISARQEDGAALVTAVRENGAAVGVLEVDDRILGIDGQLLDLASPTADLRRRVSESVAPSGPLLRIERDGQQIDLVVPMKDVALAGSAPTTANSPDVLSTLTDLALLTRHVMFVGVSVDATDSRSFSARASFRFTPSDREVSAKAP